MFWVQYEIIKHLGLNLEENVGRIQQRSGAYFLGI